MLAPPRVLLTALVGVSLLARLPAPPATAAETSAGIYDKPGVTHNEQCLATATGGPVAVRDAEGNRLRSDSGPLNDPPEARETCARQAGVRLEGIESVTAAGITLYYSWPFEHGAQSPGFIAADELAAAPALYAADANGNGMAAPPAPGEPVYRIAPEKIEFEQRYRGPSTRSWYTYSVYGLPVGAASFALMSWSWVDVAGGGIARAAVAAGALFHPADVQPITLASAGGEGQPSNGTVTARYGYVDSGIERLYGWMVTSNTFDGSCHDHMSYAGGGTALADTLCPAILEAPLGAPGQGAASWIATAGA